MINKITLSNAYSRWGNAGYLGRIVFLSCRDSLNASAHPDSKRQDRRKRRDIARYGARTLKRAGVVSCPAQKINKKRELKEMQQRMREQEKRMAKAVAARLLGVKRAA